MFDAACAMFPGPCPLVGCCPEAGPEAGPEVDPQAGPQAGP
jgi:hypothetical protein